MMKTVFLFYYLPLEPEGEIHTHSESKAPGNLNSWVTVFLRWHGRASVTSVGMACLLSRYVSDSSMPLVLFEC